jgi:hypothetical protein
MENKQAILKNLRDAHDILSKVEETVFDLHTFKRGDEVCGTIACAAGWLAMSERFAPVMSLLSFKNIFFISYCTLVPTATMNAHYNEDAGYDFSWLDEHFGPDAFDNLFCERGDGGRDKEHEQATQRYDEEGYEVDERVLPDSITDKDLALWRIEQQIAAIEGGAA